MLNPCYIMTPKKGNILKYSRKLISVTWQHLSIMGIILKDTTIHSVT